jgi:hypothetical protein
MTNLIAFLVFLALFAAAAIASVYDPKPLRKPREWTVGRMMEPRS